MRKNITREKKTECGSAYIEIDIYNHTTNKIKGQRSKKKKETMSLKQIKANEVRARRHFGQLVETNFGETGGIHITCTYDSYNLPTCIDESEKIIKNYIRRVKRKRKKYGLDDLKYILVTEGGSGGRIHHHIIMNNGISREELEDAWKLGYINADRLRIDKQSGLLGLSRYLTKERKKGHKRWSTSQNLIKPESRTNDVKYTKRKIEKLIRSGDIYDIGYWEKQYKGYTITDKDNGINISCSEENGYSVYLQLRKI